MNEDKILFRGVENEKWSAGRHSRADSFIGMYNDSINSQLKALKSLNKILHDNHQYVRIGRRFLIIRGKLASYCVSVKQLLERFNNVYSENSSSGFPRIEIHPRERWVKRPRRACIQSPSPLEIPSIDALIGYIMGLMNDNVVFDKEDIPQLRNGLIETYGYGPSPISEVLSVYLATYYGAVNDIEKGEIRVKGTDGWTWHLEYGDPEILEFSLYSSVRGGEKRLHVEDTKRAWVNYNCVLENMLDIFSTAPKSFLGDRKGVLKQSSELCHSVSEKWAPLRRAIEEDGLEEWINQDYFDEDNFE